MEEILLKEKPLILITEKVQQQIDYLHQEVGKDEWSGMICYTIDGSTDELSKMVIRVTNILPYDVGNPTYTEFKFGPETLALEKVSGTMKEQKGKIHTHHDMATFFSGTDTKDLKDNYEDYNMYLSLIVNFKGPYTAKIAFKGSTIYSEMSVGKKKYKVSHGKKSMFIANCDIESEGRSYNLDDWFIEQTKKIMSNKNNKGTIRSNVNNTTYTKQNSSTGHWPGLPARNSNTNKGSESNMKTRNYSGSQTRKEQLEMPLDMGLNDVTAKAFAGKLLNLDIMSSEKFGDAAESFSTDLMSLGNKETIEGAFEVFMENIYEQYTDMVLKFFREEEDFDEITNKVCRKLTSHENLYVRKVGELLLEFAKSIEPIEA